MTETPDRPGEHGPRGDDQTTGERPEAESSSPPGSAAPHQSVPTPDTPSSREATQAPDAGVPAKTAAPDTPQSRDEAATPPSGFAQSASQTVTPPAGYAAAGSVATPPTGYDPRIAAGHGPHDGQGYGPPTGYGPQPGYGPQSGQGYVPPGGPGYPTQGGGTGYGSPQTYTPPQGYGAPQGYGPPPGYGPPGFHTAPKPGIIPLRPLGFGDFFSGAFGYIRANPASTLLPALIVAVITQLVQLVAQAALGVSRAPTSLDGASGYLARSFAASMIVVIVGLLLGAALTGVLIAVLRRATFGRQTSLGAAWQAARPRVLGLVGVALLTFVIIAVVGLVGIGLAIGLGVGIGGGGGVAVGVLLGIATIVAVIYLTVLLSLATPAYVMEDIGVAAALSRSRDLVRGVWWQIFAVLVVVALAFTVIGGVLGAIGGAFGVATSMTPGSSAPPVPGVGLTIAIAVVGVVISTFATPFLSGVTGLLYVDQRIRRERFDLQLASWAASER